MNDIIQTAGSTGSAQIGYDPINNRIRGWATNSPELLVVEDRNSLKSLEASIVDANMMRENYQATRISIRSIVTDTILLDELDPRIGAKIEAIVPFLFNGEELNIAYLGLNDPRRNSDVNLFQRQMDTLYKMLNRRTRSVERDFSSYTVDRLRDPTSADISQIIDLMSEAYARDGKLIMWYEPTVPNVTEVMSNAITYVARDENNKIVSMCAAEGSDDLFIEGQPLNAYEISDCATRNSHRGKGLLQECIRSVLDDLNHADVVFSESRIAHTPIQKAMINSNLLYAGVLRNHVRIGGDRELVEDSDIESLVVFYMGQNVRKNT